MRFNYHRTEPADRERARELRKSSSPIEKKLWAALKEATADGTIKFRYQQPIPPYIADFACMKARLLIEVDGMSHAGQVKYDQERERFLTLQNFIILRFRNDEVLKDLPKVVDAIVMKARELIEARCQHPLTSENQGLTR